MITDEQALTAIETIIKFAGGDPESDGMRDTPKRILKSIKYQYSGYNRDVKDILTVFDSENYSQMVILKDIKFYSHCEHHGEPFFGKAKIAYIPNGKIVGISKLARVVDIFARRFQNQVIIWIGGDNFRRIYATCKRDIWPYHSR